MKKTLSIIIFLCLLSSCAGKNATPTGDQTATEPPRQEEPAEPSKVAEHLNENWDDYLFFILNTIFVDYGW